MLLGGVIDTHCADSLTDYEMTEILCFSSFRFVYIPSIHILELRALFDLKEV